MKYRDHCILGEAFNTLSPHFWCFCQQNNMFFFIIQTIQLWHLLTISLFHVREQNILYLLQKEPKIGEWCNEVNFSYFTWLPVPMMPSWCQHYFSLKAEGYLLKICLDLVWRWHAKAKSVCVTWTSGQCYKTFYALIHNSSSTYSLVSTERD